MNLNDSVLDNTIRCRWLTSQDSTAGSDVGGDPGSRRLAGRNLLHSKLTLVLQLWNQVNEGQLSDGSRNKDCTQLQIMAIVFNSNFQKE